MPTELPMKALIIVVGVFVPTKLLVRYLRSDVVRRQGLKTPEGLGIYAKLNEFPDTWRPPFWLSPDELKRITS